MTEAEMLQIALAAQSEHGPMAIVEVLIERLPKSRHVQLLRVRPKQGPWGRIVALTPEGTRTRFEAHRLIRFLCATNNEPTVYGTRTIQPRTEHRVQIHPVIKRTNNERITEISNSTNQSISAVIDMALEEFLQRRA